jgi:hypothetical protein
MFACYERRSLLSGVVQDASFKADSDRYMLVWYSTRRYVGYERIHQSTTVIVPRDGERR